MNLSAKKVIYIDLNRNTYEVKLEPELIKYIGGVGTGLKVLAARQERDPVIFSTGPLNGFFPYCSKTSIVTNDDGVIEDLYLGGSLSTRMQFAGVDCIVLEGRSRSPQVIEIVDEEVFFKPADVDTGTLGLPGRRSILIYEKAKQAFVLDEYFLGTENILERKLLDKNVFGLAVTGTKTYDLKDADRAEELIKQLLEQKPRMTVLPANNPSCAGCPMGCDKSRIGELGGNMFVHSLVACQFAEKIFSDINISFSCLNALGYDYTHEDLENFPHLIDSLMQELPR